MSTDSDITVMHGTCHITEAGMSFSFWSEISGITKRKEKTIHPFSNSARDTFNLLHHAGLLNGNTKRYDKMRGFFPSSDDVPLPSGELSGLVQEASGGENTVYLMKEWEVPAVICGTDDAFTALLSMNEDSAEIGFVIGTDLRFWASVAAYAFNLIGEQKFLPAVVEEGPSVRSRWIPLLETNEDQSGLYEIIKNMPGVCLAFNHDEVNAETMVRMFLSSIMDSICRKFAGGSHNVPSVGSTAGDTTKWAVSLSSQNSLITYNRSLVIQKISSWTRRIQNRLEFPLRMCFDLVSPVDNSNRWVLRFMIQSKSDPSLLIPFSRIWNRKDLEALSIIRKYSEFPEEFLLQSLGIAQSIFPAISKSLQSANPSEVGLSTEEVFKFLKNYSGILGDAGFGILFPDWWGKAGRKLGVKVKATPASGTGKVGLNALISYNLEIVVDGEPISPEELDKLSRLKAPLVQIGQKWVEVDQDRLRNILKLMSEDRKAVSLMELLSMDAGKGSIPIVDISGEGWVGKLLNGKSKITSMEEPRNFVGKLREYQKTGASWLTFMTGIGFGCCLADDMGLGKTVEVIAFLLERKRRIKNTGVSLIVCPTSVISNWAHEIRRFSPSLKVGVHHGLSRDKEAAFINKAVDFDVILTSYALLQRDIEFLSKVRWDGVIADEAQYVKNYSTKQSKALRALEAGYRLALTGTPIENRLEDLRSIFDFINPGYLGGEKRFRELFSSPIENEGDEEAANTLNRLVNPFILRRVKSDRKIISDLPEKDEVKVFVPVTEEQASLYDATVNSMLDAIAEKEGIARKGVILSTITKLKRLLDHPSMVSGDTDRRMDRSQKLIRLMEMLQEIHESGEKTLIFTQYIEAGKIIKEGILKRFQDEALFMSGNTPRIMREQMVESFQSPDGPRIFVISVKAGGFGINLTAASNVIHFDRWWNPSVEDQATDRAYRIGQSRRVHVYKFVSTGTIEEKIDEIIEGKSSLRKKIVGTSDESWMTELTGNELKNVFTLRREIVTDGGDR
ncbi:MAG: DEAD/DEAH box helicase [Thermoplasmata archaeon]